MTFFSKWKKSRHYKKGGEGDRKLSIPSEVFSEVKIRVGKEEDKWSKRLTLVL